VAFFCNISWCASAGATTLVCNFWKHACYRDGIRQFGAASYAAIDPAQVLISLRIASAAVSSFCASSCAIAFAKAETSAFKV
jgi:hypothetical protein